MPLSDDELVADRYRITSLVDADDDGETYEAIDERLNRHVTVRFANADAVDMTEAGVLDGGVHDGQRFVVLAVFADQDEPEVGDATAAMPAMSTTVVSATPEPTTVVPRVAPQPPRVPRSSSVNPATIAAIAIAALLIGVIVFALASKDDGSDAPPAGTSTTQSTTATTRPQATTRVTDPPETEAPEPTDPPTTEEPTPDTTDAPATSIVIETPTSAG